MLKKIAGWKSKAGLSLVELITVVAIMAVLAAVLIPALMVHTERSRAQRDMSAMDEITNALLISLSDSDAYDEASRYSIINNVSCYIDSELEEQHTKKVIKTLANGDVIQYTFDGNSRLADEKKYCLAGNMRGFTITFEPVQVNENDTQYVLKEAIINKYYGTSAKFGDAQYLYNIVRQVIGNDVLQVSQTYRNSEYTIFVRISLAGEDPDKMDPVEIYGQYSGTNLKSPVNIYSEAVDREKNDTLDSVTIDPINPDDPNNGSLNGGGTTNPEEEITSGICGDNLTWSFDKSSGTLYIAGTGPMYNYAKTTMPWRHFANRLTTVKVSNGATYIGEYAFYGFNKLESLTLGSKTGSAGAGAFFNVAAKVGSCGSDLLWTYDETTHELFITGTGPMKDYTSTIMPWFDYIDELSSVTFSDYVTYVGKYSFYNFSKLATAHLGEAIAKIGHRAFDGTLIYLGPCGDNLLWSFEPLTGIFYLTGYGPMYDYTSTSMPWFVIRDQIERVKAGNAVTYIGNYAFYNHVNLMSADIGTAKIGKNAFYGSQVAIGSCGDDLTWILDRMTGILTITGTGATADYTASNIPWRQYQNEIKELVVGEEVTYLGNYAFMNCVNLERADIANAQMGTNIFRGTKVYMGTCGDTGSYIVWEFDATTGIFTLSGNGSMATYSVSLRPWASITEQITRVDIKDTVRYVSAYAFYNCSNLKEANYEETTEIGNNAFKGTQVTI